MKATLFFYVQDEAAELSAIDDIFEVRTSQFVVSVGLSPRILGFL